MPASSPPLTPAATTALERMGARVRSRRKALKINAVAAAESAGVSRVTLHRIEKGEPSVTAGAYLAVATVLGLDLDVVSRDGAVDRKGWLAARVRIADYPKLEELAWQLQGAQELSPREALDIYERNWRYVDPAALSPPERDLIDALRAALGGGPVV